MIILILVAIIIILGGLLLFGRSKSTLVIKDEPIKDEPIKEINLGKIYILDSKNPFKNQLQVMPVEIKNGYVKYKLISLDGCQFTFDSFDSESCKSFSYLYKQEINNT